MQRLPLLLPDFPCRPPLPLSISLSPNPFPHAPHARAPGIESVYWWEGEVNTDAELLLIAKTRVALLPELTAWVKANHPYDEPEVIALPVAGGSAGYLQWVLDSTRQAGSGGGSGGSGGRGKAHTLPPSPSATHPSGQM